MMHQSAVYRPKHASSGVAAVAVTIMTIEAISFLVAAVSHTGIHIPLGFAVLSERVIVAATIAESLCAAALAASAIAVLSRRSFAWATALGAQLFALAAVIVGIGALAGGAAPVSSFDSTYHRIMLVALLLGAALLCTPSARRGLSQDRA